MIKVWVLVAVLVMTTIACGGSDGSGDTAGAQPAEPASTETAEPTGTATLPRTTTATATRTATPMLTRTATPEPQRVLLSEADLGRDWLEINAGNLKRQHPAVYASFANLETEEFLTVVL